MKYEFECIKNIEQSKALKNCIKLKNNCSYLVFNNDFRLNQQDSELE